MNMKFVTGLIAVTGIGVYLIWVMVGSITAVSLASALVTR
ncbi:hypothetical protein GY50_0105 [Dehalococcoides mccartyi GY50]|nr:hypothetical protein GY50_0105 [Dehalococcoides mccartyi GY50]